jgi:hypothetical protein
LYVILRLVVQLPFLTYHYLHYLTVPHPAESAYRAGMANDLPIPDLASSVADVMYRYDHLDYAALPRAVVEDKIRRWMEPAVTGNPRNGLQRGHVVRKHRTQKGMR